MTWPALDDRWLRWLLVPAVVFISQAISDSHLVDFWHHLARGREMALQGHLLDQDVFTYPLQGQPLRDVNWLTQLGYYWLFSWGGLDLVRVLNAGLLALAWAGLVAVCRRASGSLEAAVAVALLAFLGCWQFLTIRPQTLSYLLFLGLYALLRRAETDRRCLLCALPLLTLWANVHGAFPAGLLLLGGFGAGQVLTRRHAPTFWPTLLTWGAAGLAGFLATLINPYGLGIYTYAAGLSQVSAGRGIEEWLPPSWQHLSGVIYFMSLALAVVALLLAGRRGQPLSARDAILLLGFGLMAARSIRMVPWWLFVLAPVLAERLVFLWPALRVTRYQPNLGALLSCAALLGLCVLSLPPLHACNPLLWLRPADPTTARLEAARQHLDASLGQGHLFTRLEWGEYFTWAGYPRWKIFIDGRIEIITDPVWYEYVTLMRGGPGWQAILDRYDVQALLLDEPFHRRTGLIDAVEASPHWQRVSQEGNVWLYERKR
jgi:hypothetical protein